MSFNRFSDWFQRFRKPASLSNGTVAPVGFVSPSTTGGGTKGMVTRLQRKREILVKVEPQLVPEGLRNLDCLDKDVRPGKLLGQGDFGAVYSLISTTTNEQVPWILKVSDFGRTRAQNKDRQDSFNREVYFLKRLQGSGLVPKLKSSSICDGQGIQVMERFDGSFQELGTKQAEEHNLQPKEVAVTQEQIDNVVNLVHRFDKYDILHGDLKRGNILYSDNGKRVVVADFGFTGARDSPYYPLLGFIRNYECPASVVITPDGSTKLKTSIPKNLVPYLNRWSIYADFIGGRRTFIITKTKKLKEINKYKLAKALGLPRHILKEFQSYCKDAP